MEHLVELLTAVEEQAVCVVAAGLGGIGKTALAQHFVATQARQLFPDGVIWLEATELKQELVRAAYRLGHKREPEPTPEEARSFLVEELSSRRALLVVDNVPEEPEPELWKLLPLVGVQSRTLLTSRCQTLHQHLSASAVPLNLDCWTPEASIGYLRKLGPRCKSALEPELTQMAEFVGHLPLGVRLIGILVERRVTKTPSELLEEVRRQPVQSLDSVVTGIDRGLAQTFLTAFEALTDRERLVLMTLSACARATRDAIVAEVSGSALSDAQQALERLRDWSLADFVEQSDAPWHLHDIVRIFAQAQSGCGHIIEAHRRWAAEHCRLYSRPEQHEQFARGAAEVAEAVQRLVWEIRYEEASELQFHLFTHLTQVGRLTEAVELSESLLAIAPEASAIQANQLGNLGTCYRTLGDLQKAIDFHQRSLAIEEKLGYLKDQAANLGNLGNCYLTLGDIQKAIDFHQRALAIEEKLGRLEGQACDLGNLGSCYLTLSDTQKAIDFYLLALAIEEKLGRLEGQAAGLSSLGNCYLTLGDIQKAIDFHQRALAIDEKLGRLEGQADELGYLGSCYLTLGDIHKATDFYERSLDINEKLRRLEGQAADIGNLGLCYLALGDIQNAVGFLERALDINQRLGRLDGQAACLGNLGSCHRALGSIHKAIDFHLRAFNVNQKLGRLEGQAADIGNLGICYFVLGDIDKARSHLTCAGAAFKDMGLPTDHPRVETTRRWLERLP